VLLAVTVHDVMGSAVVDAVEVFGRGRELTGGCGAAGLLELARAAAGPGAAVLEPVEDVGVADGAEALEDAADARRLVLGRVHHAAVEDGFQDQDLFRLRRPPRPRRRRLAIGAAVAVVNRSLLGVVGVHGRVGERTLAEVRAGKKWSKLGSCYMMRQRRGKGRMNRREAKGRPTHKGKPKRSGGIIERDCTYRTLCACLCRERGRVLVVHWLI
jgi:hypothetical protein